MTKESIIKINGKLYSAETGLPIKNEVRSVANNTRVGVKNSRQINAKTVKRLGAKKPDTGKTILTKATRHTTVKSQTLNRKTVKRPSSKKPIKTAPKKVMRAPGVDIIAPKIAVRPAPIVPKDSPKKSTRKNVTPQKKSVAPQKKKQSKKGKGAKKTGIITAIISAIVILLIGAAVAAYFFLPAASFEVANLRADIRGKLPAYTVENYRVSTPVQSSPGQIIVNYKSDDNEYSLMEQSSTWDSDGVLENKVKPNSKNYQTLSQKGLTIFRFDKKAIWVNGGILYTISDNNNLGNDQILKIVDSI